jgi:peptidylprolyl isomerase
MSRMRIVMLALLLLAQASCGPRTQIVAPADVEQPPEGAVTTASGLAYVVLNQGDGPAPRITDKVTVHYTGWTTDGSMFDSSVAKGRAGRFLVNGVIAGWTEALLLMRAGSKYRLWIPEELAYQGRAGFPAGMLVFEVSLISVD